MYAQTKDTHTHKKQQQQKNMVAPHTIGQLGQDRQF